MNPTNPGSFGAAAGGVSPELAEAIARRGNQSGATGQVTQGSPNYNPQIQQPQVNSAPAPSGTLGSPPSTPSGTGAGLPITPESELIIKALDSRLKSLSKIQGA